MVEVIVSKVRALISKFGRNFLEIKNTFENQVEVSPKRNSNENLPFRDRVLDELEELYYDFMVLQHKANKRQFNFDNLSEKEVCFINTCTVTITPGHYHEHTLDLATSKGVHLKPPLKYLSFKEDGSIDYHRSEKFPCFLEWDLMIAHMSYECKFPLYSIKELAKFYPVLYELDRDTLHDELYNLLKRKNIL